MTDNQKQDIPQVGDIWQEVDPRHPRFVRVEGMDPKGRVVIVTVCLYFSDWRRPARVRETTAALGRFNGKRGGYKLHHRPEGTNI